MNKYREAYELCKAYAAAWERPFTLAREEALRAAHKAIITRGREALREGEEPLIDKLDIPEVDMLRAEVELLKGELKAVEDGSGLTNAVACVEARAKAEIEGRDRQFAAVIAQRDEAVALLFEFRFFDGVRAFLHRMGKL